jgi:hypothetical protein
MRNRTPSKGSGTERRHKQKARHLCRAFISIRRTLSGGFVLDRGVVALGVGIVAFGIAFSDRVVGLGAAARALDELALRVPLRFRHQTKVAEKFESWSRKCPTTWAQFCWRLTPAKCNATIR